MNTYDQLPEIMTLAETAAYYRCSLLLAEHRRPSLTRSTPAYRVNLPIANNTPTNSGGSATFYSIVPALPTGLSLNASTGVVSGTPAVLTPIANYTVTASNAFGSTTTTLNIAVGEIPTAITGSASGKTYLGGVLNGTVNPNGLATTYFQYGLTSSYGITTGTQAAGSGTSAAPFGVAITALSPTTTYHYLLVATNSIGTTSGSDQTFTTANPPPAVTTAPQPKRVIAARRSMEP